MARTQIGLPRSTYIEEEEDDIFVIGFLEAICNAEDAASGLIHPLEQATAWAAIAGAYASAMATAF